MTSSTEPEVHNIIALSSQRQTEPRPQAMSTENFEVQTCRFWATCGQTNRHTDTLVAILCTPYGGGEVKITGYWPNDKPFHWLAACTTRQRMLMATWPYFTRHTSMRVCKSATWEKCALVTTIYRLPTCTTVYNRSSIYSSHCICCHRPVFVWPGGVVVRALDWRLNGSRFDSRPFRFRGNNLRQIVHQAV